MGEFAPFRDRIVERRERIRKTGSGRRFFAAIRATGKNVRIHVGDDYQDNAAKMDPNTTDNGVNAAVKPFPPQRRTCA